MVAPLGVLVALFFLSAPILAIVALSRIGRLQHELAEYRARTDADFERLRATFSATRAEVETTLAQEVAPFVAPIEPEAVEEVSPVTEEISPPLAPPEPAATLGSVPLVAAAPVVIKPPSFEENLTSRWLVILGGIALALAGTFLVKYSIDQGLLGPVARVAIGLLFGLALMAAGEWLRRRPLSQAIAQLKPDYVPPALSAAGVLTAFVAVYAAYGLYELIPPGFAFIGLASLSFLALALSLLQGPLIAALGLFGSFVSPLLVATGSPSAANFFSYLLFVSFASFAVLRYRSWWWLGYSTVFAVILWLSIWLPSGGEHSSFLAGFALAFATLSVLLARSDVKLLRGATDATGLARLRLSKDAFNPPVLLIYVSAAAMALALHFIFDDNGFGPVTMVALSSHLALSLAAAWRYENLVGLVFISAALLLAAMVNWSLTADTIAGVIDSDIRGGANATISSAILPPYLWFFGVLAAAAAGAGFVAITGSRFSGMWASFSALMPLASLSIGYYRVNEFQTDWRWGAVATLMAALALAAADRMAVLDRRKALAAFAVAAPTALSLAFAMTLREAWLTVALSLQLPVMAWVYRKENIPALRILSLIMAVIVLARLTVNWTILNYPLGPTPVFNWILYGYGVPVGCFWLAARWFSPDKRDLTVDILEAGAFVLFVYLTSLEIRHWVRGSGLAAPYHLFEASLQTLNWLVISFAAYVRAPRHNRWVLIRAQQILYWLALAQLLFVQLLGRNPLFGPEPVGEVPVFDVLLLAYAGPGLMLAIFAWMAWLRNDSGLARLSGLSSLGLVLFYVTMEVRHWFHGSRLDSSVVFDGELYAYSVAGLVYAGALLAAGFRWRAQVLRHAGLAMLLLTVGKVFVIDLATLDGLFRVLSFLGLGLVLVAIGYVYQRFFTLPKSDRAAASPPS